MIKVFILSFLSVLSMSAFGEDAAPASKWMTEAAVWVGLVVMIVEFLIAKSKLKANSTIEMILGLLKSIFGKK